MVSISNNIAEGFSRTSQKDFSRFLEIALGSNNEIKSMIYLSIQLEFINENEAKMMFEKCNETARIIRGLQKSVLHKPLSNIIPKGNLK